MHMQTRVSCTRGIFTSSHSFLEIVNLCRKSIYNFRDPWLLDGSLTWTSSSAKLIENLPKAIPAGLTGTSLNVVPPKAIPPKSSKDNSFTKRS
ncbi:hypothetical protein AFLA_009815 [Aspergillus flavus NRRL3357]|nr:hypothetical protein AFLA_009815 [Aspergillus flavus NRRL3357]